MRSGRRGRRRWRRRIWRRLARTLRKPTAEESRTRYEARSLRMWWTQKDKAMLHVHGQLPDVMGVRFESTIQRLTERAKPPTGHAWDSFEHRSADARRGARSPWRRVQTPPLAAKPLLVVQIPTGSRGDRRDPAARRDGRAVARQRDDRTGPGRRRRCPGHGRETHRPHCHPRSCGRCCCATGIAGSPAVRSPTASTSITSDPRAGVATTNSRTSASVRRRRASPDARPQRTLGTRRQPQPTRRATPRPPRRPQPKQAEQLPPPPPDRTAERPHVHELAR